MSRRRMPYDTPFFRLPQPPAPGMIPAHFAICPLILLQGLTAEQWQAQQLIYQRAFEIAQAVARPSLPERDLLAVWN